MGKIVLLDDSTINQIAAGEVIERPASVVKELMENSIDAGATNITVEIKNGGISYIRITDNGKGIMQDDMEMAFERHATSKLRSASDLSEIKSMGFRGEALASIASIAKIEMNSKTRDSETGNTITVEGGKILAKEEIGCPEGTSITINNLFYNTPVRYKFLKKDFTESGYIEDAVTRIALVNPNIAIKLINTGKTVIQTSGNGNLKEVIYGIYGKDVAENLIDVDYTYEDIKIEGVIGKPVISRSNRSNQLFFVNNRFIKDKTLSGAAESGFKGFVTIGKHGFLILNIKIDPSKVDVNVHPTKLEVRFQDESNIFKAVYHSIREGLLKGDLVANTESIDGIDTISSKDKYNFNAFTNYKTENKEETNFRDLAKKEPETIKEEKEEYKGDTDFNNVMAQLVAMKEKIQAETEESITENLKQGENETHENNEEEKSEERIDEKVKDIQELIEENTFNDNQKIKNENLSTNDNFMKMYEKTFGISAPKEETNKEKETNKELNMSEEFKPVTGENISVFEKTEEIKTKPVYKIIGVAFKTYIIIELKEDLYIIDQHAAHERIMYEKVKENYYSETEKDSQMMLLPDIITLTHKEMGIYEDNREMFQKAGFIADEFGENTVKLSGVPNIWIELDTKELFMETLDEINTVARTAKQEIEEKFIATVACKAAVKAHMALDKEEIEQLLDELLILPNPFTCPHGRPTAIKMTKDDIEKKFSRKQ